MLASLAFVHKFAGAFDLLICAQENHSVGQLDAQPLENLPSSPGFRAIRSGLVLVLPRC
jgi:hypothetical protein